MSDNDTDLGVQAFQDMTRAMDRFGETLTNLETHAQTRMRVEEQALKSLRALFGDAGSAAERAKEAAQEALQAAKTDFRTSGAWTALGGLLVAFLAVLGGYWLGEDSGWAQGQAAGYAHARNEKAAMAWSGTPGGQRAFSLDQLGSLDRVTTCSAPGWTISHQHEHRVCFPGPDKDGNTAGWFVP